MNITINEGIGSKDNDEKAIEYYYEQCFFYADRLFILKNKGILLDDGISDLEDQIDFCKILAINNGLKVLNLTGSEIQQCMKIKICLLLSRIYDGDSEFAIRENFFYKAVEITQQYKGDDCMSTKDGMDIYNLYTQYIDLSFVDIFPQEYIQSLLPLLQIKILSESQKRIQLSLERVADTANFIHTNDSSDDIISKLEEVFGPLRILILSEGSSGVLVRHRYNEIDQGLGENGSDNMMHIHVNIFDKSRKYLVRIDRGSDEKFNQLKESHLKHIINPIIRIFITKREYEFFTYADDNTDTIELLEKNLTIPVEVNDYSEFITNVIHYYDVAGLSRNRGNIESYARAIDVCRGVVLSLEKRDDISLMNLYSYIDVILGGNIDVIVMRSVQSMLLSCNETMNGAGYPFGLSKCNISLEGKIYSIIRAYEAIFSSRLMNQKHALETMQKWAQGGYFDMDILNIFLQSIKGNHATTKKIVIKDGGVTTYRKSEYKRHLDSWFHQLKIVRSIEDGYHEFRKAEGDKSTQNAVIKKINEYSLELRKLALIRKLIIVTRHGSTISDTPDGPPGDDHEVLTPEGIESSHIKGALFDGLEFQIVTSPLVRACETARIICQRVRGCACQIIQTDNIGLSSLECSGVMRETSIVNPQKDQDIGRYNGMAPKILADNTKDLMRYLMNMVSSSQESVTLFVTHRDSARHMIFWLMNMFDQDRIRGEKTPIDNDTMYEFYFRGDHLIEGEETKTQGLLFSTFNWRSTLHEVNSIIENIFGDIFYTIDDRGIDLIILHDIFINFMHRKNEESPEKIGLFIEQLSNNPVTKNFPDILKRTGLIE